MGNLSYLKTDRVMVRDVQFTIRELSWADFQYVKKGDEDQQAVRTVQRGVIEFTDKSEEEVAALLPVAMMGELSLAVMEISGTEEVEKKFAGLNVASSSG